MKFKDWFMQNEMWYAKGRAEQGKGISPNPPSAYKPKGSDYPFKPSANRLPRPSGTKKCGTGGGSGKC